MGIRNRKQKPISAPGNVWSLWAPPISYLGGGLGELAHRLHPSQFPMAVVAHEHGQHAHVVVARFSLQKHDKEKQILQMYSSMGNNGGRIGVVAPLSAWDLSSSTERVCNSILVFKTLVNQLPHKYFLLKQ